MARDQTWSGEGWIAEILRQLLVLDVEKTAPAEFDDAPGGRRGAGESDAGNNTAKGWRA